MGLQCKPTGKLKGVYEKVSPSKVKKHKEKKVEQPVVKKKK